MLALFEQHQVRLIVVTDAHFGENAASRLMSNIVAAAAEFQQEMTRERMADARTILNHKGRRIAGRIPFGYSTDPATKQLVIRPEQANLVRRIFEMAASGKSPQQIVAIAKSEDWEGTGQWTARQILKVLSSPIYVGNIHDCERTLPGCHPPIVTSEVFEQARQKIQNRRSRRPGRTSAEGEWPLRGLIKCGQCGRTMIPSISGYKNFLYRNYPCRSDSGGRRPCRDVSLPAFQIEQFVRSLLSSDEWLAVATAGDHAPEFAAVWCAPLDELEQIKALADIVQEMTFDPKTGTILTTLVEDPASKLRARSK